MVSPTAAAIDFDHSSLAAVRTAAKRCLSTCQVKRRTRINGMQMEKLMPAVHMDPFPALPKLSLEFVPLSTCTDFPSAGTFRNLIFSELFYSSTLPSSIYSTLFPGILHYSTLPSVYSTPFFSILLPCNLCNMQVSPKLPLKIFQVVFWFQTVCYTD